MTTFLLQTFQRNFPFHRDADQEGFVLLNTCNQPKSRGSVQLYSSQIKEAPKINPNYLENASDVACMMRSIRLAMQLVGTQAFRKVNAVIHWPEFKQCSNFGPPRSKRVQPNDRYLECLIRVASVTAHHPGGSCAVGSVLDAKMRVRGVKSIRVVDASMLPTPVSGTPHASIVAVAEYAAEQILRQF